MPITGRSLIGTVAGFKSEWWPVFDWIGGRLQIGIRNATATSAAAACFCCRTIFSHAGISRPRLPSSVANCCLNSGSCVSSAVLQSAALLTADGFLLNSAGVVVQLASASEIATAPRRRANSFIFTVIKPLKCPRGEHRRNQGDVKFHVKISLTQRLERNTSVHCALYLAQAANGA